MTCYPVKTQFQHNAELAHGVTEALTFNSSEGPYNADKQSTTSHTKISNNKKWKSLLSRLINDSSTENSFISPNAASKNTVSLD